MMKNDEAYKRTAEDFERSFLNAQNLYDRYKIVKQLLSWIDDLEELLELKNQEIKRLQNNIKGYDLDEYRD